MIASLQQHATQPGAHEIKSCIDFLAADTRECVDSCRPGAVATAPKKRKQGINSNDHAVVILRGPTVSIPIQLDVLMSLLDSLDPGQMPRWLAAEFRNATLLLKTVGSAVGRVVITLKQAEMIELARLVRAVEGTTFKESTARRSQNVTHYLSMQNRPKPPSV